MPYLAGELARAPELWIQKGYLARVVASIARAGSATRASSRSRISSTRTTATRARSRSSTTPAVTIVPALYVRHGGRLAEHVMPPHPLYAFDGDDYRAELRARLDPLLA